MQTTEQDTTSERFKEASLKKRSVLGDWFGFLSKSKKWWLMPMVVVLLLLGALFVLSGTVAAPFIYTLF
jgi:hypothetical protein